MRIFALSVLAVAALAAQARDLTIPIDTSAPARDAFPQNAPCVGYSTDPKTGDEAAALACRRAGAWRFRTSCCDAATLRFCAQYGLRLFLVLNGDTKGVVATLNRLAQSPDKAAVAGFEFGFDPGGGGDPEDLRARTSAAARLFPQLPIALSVKDLESPAFVKFAAKGCLRPVTHLVADLRDVPAPYDKLAQLAEGLRRACDKSVAKLRLLAVGPECPVAWQMHWIMSALAVGRTDGVFIERPCRADDFGLAMRHFWAVTTLCRSLIGHGEGATAVLPASGKAKALPPKPPRADANDEDALELEDSSDADVSGPRPVACANVAKGGTGDIEYLLFLGEPTPKDGRRVFIALVNTSGERTKVSVDVDGRGGWFGLGWRRRLVPDGEKGAMRSEMRERTGRPLAVWVEPGEVTFFDLSS